LASWQSNLLKLRTRRARAPTGARIMPQNAAAYRGFSAFFQAAFALCGTAPDKAA